MLTETTPINPYHSMPKVELHRHLEGSLRLVTLVEIAREHGVSVPDNVLNMSERVQVQDGDLFTHTNFLEKFKTLRLFYRSPEVINRLTREAVEDAARDNVRYLELRFTPVALSRAEGFPIPEVMNWVITSARDTAVEQNIKVALIASVNRHESPELAEQVARQAAGLQERGLVGLDLAGNEADFECEPFYGIFNEARQSGLRLTIHAGEWGPASNVREAILEFNADRIGHGVRILEDDSVVALARERGTALEVCLTSNYQSGVIPSLADHPFPRMLAAGLNATLNTDDPSVSRITLGREYQVAVDELHVPLQTVKQRTLASMQAAFLVDGERDDLVNSLKTELEL